MGNSDHQKSGQIFGIYWVTKGSMNTSTIFQRLRSTTAVYFAPEIHSTTASCRAARPWRPVSHNAIYWTLATAHQREECSVFWAVWSCKACSPNDCHAQTYCVSQNCIIPSLHHDSTLGGVHSCAQVLRKIQPGPAHCTWPQAASWIDSPVHAAPP